MKIYRSLAEMPSDLGPTALTIGNFDGVHVGHRQIFARVVGIAKAEGLTSCVLTFNPHPARVLAPERAPKLLMSQEQRLREIGETGIEAAVVIPFTMVFAAMSSEEFVRQVLVSAMHVRVVVVGEDFRFGAKQSGNIHTLRDLGEKLGFRVEPVEVISRSATRHSSTLARELVVAGKVSRAGRVLGEPFALEGAVVKGQGIGSKQTVPTLNLAPESEVIPLTGVYVTRTSDLLTGQRWNSITNVGYRPTFDGDHLTVETFLLDPLGDTQPERIRVEFLRYVRPEKRFENPAALKTQILQDIRIANTLHRRISKIRVG